LSLEWHEIIVKFSGQCIQCDGWILKDETALWMMNLGLKHIECPVKDIDLEPDNTSLVILDNDAQKRIGYKNE